MKMQIEVCKSKIAHAIITEAELFYEGSITVDEKLMKAVDLFSGEKVHVLNLNNGTRFETYVIPGKPGQICLNGPAARLGIIGDQITILSYALIDAKEAINFKMKIIHLDDKNKIKN